MCKFYDIHRHDQFSLFDGFGNADQVAEYAKKLKYRAIGSTNHGNITGLIKHFKACAEQDIVPILGCEMYFQPKIDNEKDSYHLCIYAKNLTGWKNLNKLITISNTEDHFYYKPRISFKDLEENSKGLICSTACVGGFIPQMFCKNKTDNVDKAINKFIKIFGKKNFFFEIMPIELKDAEGKGKENLQIKLNNFLIEKAKEFDVSVIATSDSHFVKKEDFPTYLKMHEIKGTKIGSHYELRYMHSEDSFFSLLKKYHKNDFKFIVSGYDKFLEVVGDSREWFKFSEDMPAYTETPQETYELMKKQAIKFLKEKGKTSSIYKERLKHEFDVIKYHGFQDYFMVVQDYVNWAKKNDIAVGPGRGSAGNSLVNYSLGITLVDPVEFKNDFGRFLRKDKKKFPDIDVDFGQDRRDEVIKYIIEHYKGKAAQTITYGCYNVKNLINDLAKVCGVTDNEELESIKKFCFEYCDDNENIINEELYNSSKFDKYNAKYDNIMIHFTKMYGKVRYFGTHASAVILSSSDIDSLAGLCKVNGSLRTSFDLHDIEFLGLLKLDILGLSSATKAKELEKLTGKKFTYSMLNDKATLKTFDTDPTAIFQFESAGGIALAKQIGIDSFEDVIASVALNRPGPLSLRMPEQYRENKLNPPENTPWFKYTKQSYGTLIYQEQAMAIAREIGEFDNADADDIAKRDIVHIPRERAERYKNQFLSAAPKHGLSEEEANNLFTSILGYSFNRGHAVGYAMLSAELGWFKTHYPDEFWYITLKYENKDDSKFRDEALYIKSGGIVLLPHVNGSIDYSIVNYEGDRAIQKGLTTIKGVGEKAAESIINERNLNGPFTDVFEFEKRCKCRAVTSRVIDALEDSGALEFNEKKFLKRVEKYNLSIMLRG